MTVRLSKRQPIGGGWTAWVVLALQMLPVLDGLTYGISVSISAIVLALIPGVVPRTTRVRDRQDLLVVAGLYVAVVALMRLAFVGVTTDTRSV